MSKVKEITSEDQYRDILRNSGANRLVVVDFFATWCGPCMNVAPHFANLSTKYSNVTFVKVDTDKNRSIASNAGVRSLPTFMFFKNNVKLTEVIGGDVTKLEQLILQYGDRFEAFTGSGKTLASSSSASASSGSLAGKTVDRSLLLKRFGGGGDAKATSTSSSASQSSSSSTTAKPPSVSSSSSSSTTTATVAKSDTSSSDDVKKSSSSSSVVNELGLTEEEMDTLTEEQLLKRAIQLSMKRDDAAEEVVDEAVEAETDRTNSETSKSGALPSLEIVLDQNEKVPSTEEVLHKIETEMVNQAVLNSLLSMEFSKTRALKALLATGGAASDEEKAIEWLVEHQADEDIDEQIQFNIVTYEMQQEKLKSARERAKQLQAEARKKVALIEKQKEKEREQRRINEGKATLKTLREIEEAQKRRDAEAAKLEKKRLAEERARVKRIQEEDQARRRIERLKREGKLDEVAEIERQFGWASTAPAASSASSSSTTTTTTTTSAANTSSSSASSSSNECAIRLRLLNGETQACSFSANDTLQVVFDQASLLQQGNRRFSLMTPMPRKVFRGADLKQTLKQLGLCPKCQLVCSPAV